jgi:hypothetical protein
LKKKFLSLMAAALVLASTTAYAAKQGFPEQVIPDNIGVAIHLHGEQDAQAKQIAEAGFKWVRMDFFWFFVEQEKGKYDFSPYDKLLASFEKHGIRMYYILSYGNELYSGNKDDKFAPSTPEYRKAYANYAAAAAKHFKGKGVIWEIWNEPNAGGFWKPQPKVEDYMAMAKEAAAAIRAADPDACIVGPSCYAIDFPFLDQCFKSGLLKSVDGVSVHPYGHWPPDKAVDTYPALQKLIKDSCGKDLPIVSGEWGFSTAAMSGEVQAQFLTRMMLTNEANGVRLSIWYDWHDDGDDPKNWEHNFGTVKRDFTPKESYKATQVLTTALKGHKFVRRLKTDRADDFVFVFSDGKEYKLAAWTISEPHDITLKINSPAIVITHMLGRRQKGEIKDSALKLTIDGSPRYINSPFDGKALDLK